MGSGNSKPVRSNQPGPHPRLAERVERHLTRPWRKPDAAHNAPALAALAERLAADRRPRILDSFCGTGDSTRRLARAHPQRLVIGVDKSARRLAAHGAVEGGYLLLHADCEAVWRALADSGERLDRHYLLYPNPWPKAAQLGRRVHGHPAFPLLLTLGGELELRSNWRLYAEEFGVALHLAGIRGRVAALPPGPALTPFEAKYRASGHRLWHCRARLSRL